MRPQGFTLVELLVALSAMAVLAVLSWQGVDSMARTQAAVQARNDDVGVLRSALAQWRTDLEAVVQQPPEPTAAVAWDGRALRLVRRSALGQEPSWLVVAWAAHNVQGQSTWVRWQSPPVRSSAELAQAWQAAQAWAQSPDSPSASLGTDTPSATAIVPLMPVTAVTVFVARDGVWVNPQSSGNTQAAPDNTAPSAGAGAGAGAGNTNTTTNTKANADNAAPEGVRLILTLPASVQGGGRLTTDWVNPTLAGARS